MARIYGLEQVEGQLRSALQTSLRVGDEAVTLPGASRSVESGAFKNIVFNFSGTDTTALDESIFSEGWFSGISFIELPTETVQKLLASPGQREVALHNLARKIQSELTDSEVTVGPQLDGDESDRDTSAWTCGFDGHACCVGIYSAIQSHPPLPHLTGFDRNHLSYFLLCKAGGGVAAQTFHSRFVAALRKNIPLDQALEQGNEPGPQALRRVATAAKRNRQRILALAAETLGIHSIDTIGDNASAPTCPHQRGAITLVDVVTNSIRKVHSSAARSTWQYTTGVDTTLSTGLVSCSNLADGFLTFTSSIGDFKCAVRNEAYNSIPYATPRLTNMRELSTIAAEAHKRSMKTEMDSHPDYEFLARRFSWKSRNFGQTIDIEPPALWGSHATEQYVASWARELGLSTLKQVRLQPELVSISAMPPSKLRAAIRFVNGP